MTGAAAGIGAAIAKRLAAAGAEVVVEAVNEVLSLTGRIDIWINNAGIAGRALPLWPDLRPFVPMSLKVDGAPN